jgi:hypothetical protein
MKSFGWVWFYVRRPVVKYYIFTGFYIFWRDTFGYIRIHYKRQRLNLRWMNSLSLSLQEQNQYNNIWLYHEKILNNTFPCGCFLYTISDFRHTSYSSYCSSLLKRQIILKNIKKATITTTKAQTNLFLKR